MYVKSQYENKTFPFLAISLSQQKKWHENHANTIGFFLCYFFLTVRESEADKRGVQFDITLLFNELFSKEIVLFISVDLDRSFKNEIRAETRLQI